MGALLNGVRETRRIIKNAAASTPLPGELLPQATERSFPQEIVYASTIR